MYLPDTAVLVTRFYSDEGVGEVTDAMPLGHRALRAPAAGGRGARRGGVPHSCRPAFDYARAGHRVTSPATAWRASRRTGDPAPSCARACRCRPRGRPPACRFRLRAGESAWFVLQPTEGGERWTAMSRSRTPSTSTRAFWRALAAASHYRGRWREMVQRSAITLKLCTYAPTGAIVAAPTCSLPEAIGGARNWDYRYAWLRDSAFTVYALACASASTTRPATSCDWLEDRLPRDATPTARLQIVYGIDGRHRPHRGELAIWRATAARAGADRQRRPRPAPARHLRRADGRRLPVQQVRRADLLRPVDQPAAAARLAGRQLAAARRGHLGGARRPARLRLLAADVLGGLRARAAHAGRSAGCPATRASAGTDAATRSTRRS